MTTQKQPVRIALTDDHVLVRCALAELINGFGECQVIHQSSNGRELVEALEQGATPQVIILDLHMPDMNGFDTAQWLRNNRPEIHIIMLSNFDSELSMIRLLQAGVRGFLKKDIGPSKA